MRKEDEEITGGINMERYVITIEANLDINGTPCKKMRFAGISSCYPCWSFHDDEYCKSFFSVESAERWLNENKRELFSEHWLCRYKLDLTTLAIRKIVYEKVASVVMTKNE